MSMISDAFQSGGPGMIPTAICGVLLLGAAVLYAVRPTRGYFGISSPGRITVDAEGKTTFTSDASGRHQYLTLTPEQRAKSLEALIQLASQPPDSLHRR